MIFLKENNNKNKIETEISSTPVFGQPDDAFEQINKYGTYQIQPTAETENDYPAIAQGLPEKEKKKHRDF